jgi:hypothetical protein
MDSFSMLKASLVRRLFVAMLLMVPVLMSLSVLSQDFPTLHSRFDIDAEATVPAWYSSILLFNVALCSVAIYHQRRVASPDAKWPYHWLLFAAAYLFFSVDEAARIHEALGNRLNTKWIFIYAPLAAAFYAYCAYYLVFVETDKRLCWWVLAGMSVFGLGALGMEAWTYFFYSAATELTEVIIEESLEMAGTTLVLIGCLKSLIRSVETATQSGR